MPLVGNTLAPKVLVSRVIVWLLQEPRNDDHDQRSTNASAQPPERVLSIHLNMSKRESDEWSLSLHRSVVRESSGDPLPSWLRPYLPTLHATFAVLKMHPPKHRGKRIHTISESHPCSNYTSETSEEGTTYRHAWTSRDHRKHRHVCYAPTASNHPRHAKGLRAGLKHLMRIEYWNVSWWVAQAFTWGSVVWCVNGFCSLLPLIYPDTFGDPLHSSGWTAWVGATIFEVGSVFGMWEAWNRDDVAAFGYNVLHKWHDVEHDVEEAAVRHLPRRLNSKLVHSETRNGKPREGDWNNKNGYGRGQNHDRQTDSGASSPTLVGEGPVMSRKRWIWWSTEGHYFRELGFLAAFFQMMGATIFWISGFTALPAIQEAIEHRTGVYAGIFWVPQVVGGMGFIISS
ncbi:integral membrane protein [Coprinopsis cinerea okayama7|uniref:Integral membrane protein n=1 Tax=Coprinopsis cinerea (strain Okayama-7 / 130 / ATCC MYA-4618 / FGSC 9003) TaxID=240176 RepID=A8P5E6_COPC7|nr:integral membrane protein [Coprinopsis cinerea okayama7\|eukprot:XP_001838924.2 integral membrane protein [Coprinopsis cinerea okayama7\